MAEELYKQETFKLKYCLFFVFIILFFSIPITSAYTFLNIYVDNDGRAVFLGETSENITLPPNIDLTGRDITGFTTSLTSKEEDIWKFEYSLEGAEINLILPRGAIVRSFEGEEIFLDGDRINIYANNEISASYVLGDAPDETLDVPLLMFLLSALLILVVFLINYSKREPKIKENEENSKIDIIKNVLNKREKEIIEKLRETGKIKSSYLRKSLDMPKASFSRHIQELEKKEIIERSGDGRNKFVELKGSI